MTENLITAGTSHRSSRDAGGADAVVVERLTKRDGGRAAGDNLSFAIPTGTVAGLTERDGRGRQQSDEEGHTMRAPRSRTALRAVTVGGLVVGALGIAILWASGVAFPFYPPPGIVVLLAGAVFVGLARWRWAPGLGAFLGLFVFVGFLISPTGLTNLSGRAGTSVAIGQGVQVIGVLTALIGGVLATRATSRTPAPAAP